MKKDFNSLFWAILGVNHRVFEPLDIFKVKRDKQADEEAYDNFLKSDALLSNVNYFQQLTRESEIFHVFFIYHLLGDNESNQFYIHQLSNISNNYKIFKQANLEDKKYVDMFSFQIALVIENMNSKDIDTSLFNDAIEISSIMPFINRCKSESKSKTQKALSIALSYKNSEMYEFYSEKDVFIEEISPSTFEKDLSKWKKKKELPSFIKMLVILNSISKGHTPEKVGLFIQLLIVRALLYIQREFKTSDRVKSKIIKQIDSFRSLIKEYYSINEENKIFELQQKYLINFPSYKNIHEVGISDTLKQLKLEMDKFFDYNYSNKTVNIIGPNRELIIEKFNNSKTKDDYFELLRIIEDVPSNELYSQNINVANNFVRFLIAIKIEDIILFNEKFKYLDRSFGTLLSMGGIDSNLNECINILKNKNDLLECLNIISEHFKRLSTLG